MCKHIFFVIRVLNLNILLQIHKQLNPKHAQCIAGWIGTMLNFN